MPSKMDPRCPRQLSAMPCEFCPLAVLRLRAIRTSAKELSEEEEAALPGCPWAVQSQMSNYCFFSFIEQNAEQSLSEAEVAALNCISSETVKKVEKRCLSKMRGAQHIKDLKESLNGESIVPYHATNEDYKIYR